MYEALRKLQNELKVPKGNYNSFGGFKYRSCEDILEAVKPLALKHGLTITVSDEVVMVGERYYVKATATVHGYAITEPRDRSVSVAAYAREDGSRKGMDGAQITGSASSYARKYALCGLLLIDDANDPDAAPGQAARDRKPAAPANAWLGKALGLRAECLAKGFSAESLDGWEREELGSAEADDWGKDEIAKAGRHYKALLANLDSEKGAGNVD